MGYRGFRSERDFWAAGAGQQQDLDADGYDFNHPTSIDYALNGGFRPAQGTLYDSSMGNVEGGSVEFWNDGTNHHTYHGDGLRVSSDTYPDGSISDPHATDQNARKRSPGRHP